MKNRIVLVLSLVAALALAAVSAGVYGFAAMVPPRAGQPATRPHPSGAPPGAHHFELRAPGYEA